MGPLSRRRIRRFALLWIHINNKKAFLEEGSAYLTFPTGQDNLTRHGERKIATLCSSFRDPKLQKRTKAVTGRGRKGTGEGGPLPPPSSFRHGQ